MVSLPSTGAILSPADLGFAKHPCQCWGQGPANRRSAVDLGLADARVLVVGGSRGMGRAAAETFAREGARVAVLARASEVLDDTVATLRSAGSPESVPVAADLTDPSEVESAIDRLGERWEALEVLVN